METKTQDMKTQVEQIAQKTREQMAQAITGMKAELHTKTKQMATRDELEELYEKTAKVAQLEQALRTQGDTINQLRENGRGGHSAPSGIAAQLKAWLADDENKKKWAQFRNGEIKGFSIPLEMKSAINMTIATNTSQPNTYVPQPEFSRGLVDLARNRPFIMEYANVAATGSASIVWAEKSNPQGNAQFIGEGILKPLVSFDIASRRSDAKKVADKIKVSVEMLDDIDFMAAEIEKELKYQVDIVTDNELLTGSGSGDHLKGLANIASAYVLTSVKTPNDIKTPSKEFWSTSIEVGVA